MDRGLGVRPRGERAQPTRLPLHPRRSTQARLAAVDVLPVPVVAALQPVLGATCRGCSSRSPAGVTWRRSPCSTRSTRCSRNTLPQRTHAGAARRSSRGSTRSPTRCSGSITTSTTWTRMCWPTRRIEDGRLRVGDEEYELCPGPADDPHKIATLEALERFVAAGGRVLGTIFLPDRAFCRRWDRRRVAAGRDAIRCRSRSPASATTATWPGSKRLHRARRRPANRIRPLLRAEPVAPAAVAGGARPPRPPETPSSSSTRRTGAAATGTPRRTASAKRSPPKSPPSGKR